MKTKVYLWKHCLWKHFLGSKLPQTPSNLIWLTIFEIQGFWHSLNLKLEQLICTKALEFILLDNHYPDLLTEGQICIESRSIFA